MRTYFTLAMNVLEMKHQVDERNLTDEEKERHRVELERQKAALYMFFGDSDN